MGAPPGSNASSAWGRRNPSAVGRAGRGRDISAFDDGSGCAHGFEAPAELLGDALGVEGVADHLGPDEDDDFRPRAVLAGVAEYVAEIFDLVEARYTGFVVVLFLADEAAEQHGLAARH